MSGNKMVGVGAGSLDFHLPIGEVTPGEQVGGVKNGFKPEHHDMFPNIYTDPNVIRTVGGNIVGVTGLLQSESQIGDEVGVITATGADVASSAIRAQLERLGIVTSASIQHEDMVSSMAIIEREAIGSDRMLYGSARGRLGRFIRDDQLEYLVDADMVAVASLKDPGFNQRVFEAVPNDAFLSFNPGGSEFGQHPEALLWLMKQRRPDLLALNEMELFGLLGEGFTEERFKRRTPQLVENATAYADTVLCTMGVHGIYLARRLVNGRVEKTFLPTDQVEAIDTTGAGDRAHALSALWLFEGRHSDMQIIEGVQDQTASVVRGYGGLEDKYGPMDIALHEDGRVDFLLAA